MGAGVLIAASLPPFGWWPLAYVGVAALFLLARGQGWRARAVLGGATGLGQFGVGLWWVHEFSIPGLVALIVVSALFTAAAMAVVPSGRLATMVVAMPAAWVLANWARDHWPLHGFPLGGISLGQSGSPLVPVVRLGGSLALTGVTVLVGVTLALVVIGAGEVWRGRVAELGGVRWSALVAGALGLCVLLPVAGALGPDGSSAHASTIRVGLVQGGGPRGTRSVGTDPQVVFDRQVAASARLPRSLDLVLWPEGVFQSDGPFQTTANGRAIVALAQMTGATVVAGVEQDVDPSHYTNQAVAWNSAGTVVGSYEKNHLVPFGEYVPARSLLKHFFNLNDVPADAIRGHGPAILRTPAGPLAVMISYEVFFDDRALSGVRAGGELLVVPTNTASYRSTEVPTEELAASELRARETGRWLVQASPTGYTAVITPDGRVTQRTRLDDAAVVVATVPLESGQTWYVRWRDWPVVGVAAAALAGALILTRSGRRGRVANGARGRV